MINEPKEWNVGEERVEGKGKKERREGKKGKSWKGRDDNKHPKDLTCKLKKVQ